MDLELVLLWGQYNLEKLQTWLELLQKVWTKGFKIVIVLGGLKNDLRFKLQIGLLKISYVSGWTNCFRGVSLGSNHPLGNGKHGPRKDCWSPSVSGDVNHQVSRVRRKLRTEIKREQCIDCGQEKCQHPRCFNLMQFLVYVKEFRHLIYHYWLLMMSLMKRLYKEIQKHLLLKKSLRFGVCRNKVAYIGWYYNHSSKYSPG